MPSKNIECLFESGRNNSQLAQACLSARRRKRQGIYIVINQCGDYKDFGRPCEWTPGTAKQVHRGKWQVVFASTFRGININLCPIGNNDCCSKVDLVNSKKVHSLKNSKKKNHYGAKNNTGEHGNEIKGNIKQTDDCFGRVMEGLVYGICADIGQRSSMEDEHIIVENFDIHHYSSHSTSRTIEEIELSMTNPEGEKIRHSITRTKSVTTKMTSEKKSYSFVAIYDGHGGREASGYCKDRLHYNVAKHFVQNVSKSNLSDRNDSDPMYEALKKGVNTTEEEFVRLARRKKLYMMGCTSIALVFSNKHYWTAHLGDTRAVLSRKGVAITLTEDHTAKLMREKTRVESMGGHIKYGYVGYSDLHGGIEVTRSFGDITNESGHKIKGLIAEPEIHRYEMEKDDEFIILACDGLWDVLSSQKAVDIVREFLKKRNNVQLACVDLMQKALRRSEDNVTICIVGFGHAPGNGTERIVPGCEQISNRIGQKRRSFTWKPGCPQSNNAEGTKPDINNLKLKRSGGGWVPPSVARRRKERELKETLARQKNKNEQHQEQQHQEHHQKQHQKQHQQHIKRYHQQDVNLRTGQKRRSVSWKPGWPQPKVKHQQEIEKHQELHLKQHQKYHQKKLNTKRDISNLKLKRSGDGWVPPSVARRRKERELKETAVRKNNKSEQHQEQQHQEQQHQEQQHQEQQHQKQDQKQHQHIKRYHQQDVNLRMGQKRRSVSRKLESPQPKVQQQQHVEKHQELHLKQHQKYHQENLNTKPDISDLRLKRSDDGWVPPSVARRRKERELKETAVQHKNKSEQHQEQEHQEQEHQKQNQKQHQQHIKRYHQQDVNLSSLNPLSQKQIDPILARSDNAGRPNGQWIRTKNRDALEVADQQDIQNDFQIRHQEQQQEEEQIHRNKIKSDVNDLVGKRSANTWRSCSQWNRKREKTLRDTTDRQGDLYDQHIQKQDQNQHHNQHQEHLKRYHHPNASSNLLNPSCQNQIHPPWRPKGRWSQARNNQINKNDNINNSSNELINQHYQQHYQQHRQSIQ